MARTELAPRPAESAPTAPRPRLRRPAGGPGTVRTAALRHRGLLLGGVGLGVVGVASALVQPVVVSNLIEAVANDNPVLWIVVLLAALFVADAALSVGEGYLIGRAGENIVRDARVQLSGRVLRAELAGLQAQQQGDVQTRLVADTSLVKIAIAQSVAQLVVNGLTVVGGVVLMAWIDVWLLLVAVACLGVASLGSISLARGLRRHALENRDDTGAFGADLQRVLSAITTVKAAGAEEREQSRLAGLAERARVSGVRVSALNAMLSPAMNVGLQASLAAVMGVGMARVATGSLSAADFTAFLMYLFYLVSPLVLVFLSIGSLQQGRAAVQRVDELDALPQEEPPEAERPAPAPAPVAADTPAVEFRDVRFGYGERTVLDGVSFTVPQRGLTALIGPSGTGKTTTFQLIERFYRPREGTVLLAGRDIADLPLKEVRGRVGYVEQDTPALRGTLRENIRYAAPDATEEELREAVDLAGLTGVVAELPDGLDTHLGDQGVGLSGGQRQRLCIARALLQRPDVILLDEATSQLDSDTETALRASLRRISRRCAVVAIAHRISTVVDADRIVVMEEGRVRATGRHVDLMVRDDLYRRLASAQLDGAGAAA